MHLLSNKTTLSEKDSEIALLRKELEELNILNKRGFPRETSFVEIR